MGEEEIEIVELLDIIDREDKVVGSAQREAIYKDGSWHRGVQVIILNSAGELLLCMRSPKKKYFPNTYDCSISEHVKSNETYLDAAVRGLTEEIGVRNMELQPLLKFRLCKEPHENAIFILYAGKHDGEFHGSEEEVQNVHFLPLEKIKEIEEKEPQLFSPWTREILRWYCGLPSLVEVIVNYKLPEVEAAEVVPVAENNIQIVQPEPKMNELPVDVVTAEPKINELPVEVVTAETVTPAATPETPHEILKKEELPTQAPKKPEGLPDVVPQKAEETSAKIAA